MNPGVAWYLTVTEIEGDLSPHWGIGMEMEIQLVDLRTHYVEIRD